MDIPAAAEIFEYEKRRLLLVGGVLGV
jgi:hypothetical protein